MNVDVLSQPPSLGSVFARAALSVTKRGRKPELGQLALGLDGVRSESDRLAYYQRVCGFPEGDLLPATWLHILAFPLHGALMTDERFPFPMIGLVHISNVITQHRPLQRTDSVDIRARVDNLRSHEKGLLFSIFTDISLQGSKVWEEESTFLCRGRFPSAHAPEAETSNEDAPVEAPDHMTTWSLPEDLGRRYGRASGDMNPIHLHALAARAFGFKRAIAHGMWTQARALACLSDSLGDRPFSLSTFFKLPIFLPNQVSFRTQSSEGQTLFEVRDRRGEKPHARGKLTLR